MKFINKNSGNWIAVGVAIGAVIFALTQEPVWIATGIALGAAIDWTSREKNSSWLRLFFSNFVNLIASSINYGEGIGFLN